MHVYGVDVGQIPPGAPTERINQSPLPLHAECPTLLKKLLYLDVQNKDK